MSNLKHPKDKLKEIEKYGTPVPFDELPEKIKKHIAEFTGKECKDCKKS